MTSRLLACAIVVLTGCGPGGLDDGDAVEGCVECRPGALVAGRFYLGSSGRFAANANGQVVRAIGADGETHLFDAEFRKRERLPDLGFVSFTDWPIRIDSAANVAALNDDGNVVLIDSGAARIRWEQPLHKATLIEVSETLVFVGAAPAAGSSTGPSELHAFRNDTGVPAWMRAMPGIASGAVRSDGAIIVGGTFTGVLDLGGDTMPASSASPAGWLAVLDAGGVARSSIVVGQGSEAEVSITTVAVAANGNIAVVGRWTGGSVNIGTVTLPAAPTSGSGIFVAMVGADGVLQWARMIGTSNQLEFAQSWTASSGFTVTSLLTDGVDAFISGTYWLASECGFSAKITRETTAWAASVAADSDVAHLRLLSLVEPDQIIAALVWNSDRCAGPSCEGSWFRYRNHETEAVKADTVNPGSVIARLRR